MTNRTLLLLIFATLCWTKTWTIETTTVTTLPELTTTENYYVSDGSFCEFEDQYITSQENCESAAMELNLPMENNVDNVALTFSSPAAVRGCYQWESSLYFNLDTSGLTFQDTTHKSICIVTTEAPSPMPTATMPSVMPTTTMPSMMPLPQHPSSSPTTSHPTMAPTSNPSKMPTSDPSLNPTAEPSLAPTTSEPTESPTWSASYSQKIVVFDNDYSEIITNDDVDTFLADCTIAVANIIAIGDVPCANVHSASNNIAVTFVGNLANLQVVEEFISNHGLDLNNGLILHPEGWFATSTTSPPTFAPTDAIVCGSNEELVTVDVKVGTWYDATITQLWTLSESCEHMSGYMDSDSGFTTHTKTCCLPPGTYTLRCYSGPTFGWMGGNVKVNGVEYCNIDEANSEESYEISLCPNGSNCGEPPADFYELTEECDGGYVPQISMAIGTSSSSSAQSMSWKLTDVCQGGNYPPLPSFGNHEYHSETCCLPKGKYTLTCSSTGVFTWQGSFLLVNGRQYCFGSDGGESHVIDMCSGDEDCPDFTTNEVGSTFQPQIEIGGQGPNIDLGGEGNQQLSGEIAHGEQFNDSCFFANDGECDVGGFVPLCNEGTDCEDCGNCDEIFTGSSETTFTNSNSGGVGPEIYITIILVCVAGFGIAIYLLSKQQTKDAKTDLENGQKQLPTSNSPSISLNREISLQRVVDVSSNDSAGGAMIGKNEETRMVM